MKLSELFIILLGILYCSAAIHRSVLKEDRLNEVNNVLKMPKYTDLFIIIFEAFVGISLLMNVSYKNDLLKLFLVFLLYGCFIITINNWNKIKESYHEVWTFQPTFMSLGLHLVYCVAILFYLISQNEIKIDYLEI